MGSGNMKDDPINYSRETFKLNDRVKHHGPYRILTTGGTVELTRTGIKKKASKKIDTTFSIGEK